MWQWLVRFLGHRAVHRQVAGHVEHGGILDLRFGAKLLRDRRVPVRGKLVALALGFAFVAILLACEFPLEALLAIVLPVIGLVPDALVDGMEMVIGPLLFASLMLPYLIPSALTQQLRAEHLGLTAARAPHRADRN